MSYTRELAEEVLKDRWVYMERSPSLTPSEQDFLNHKFPPKPTVEVGKWYFAAKGTEHEAMVFVESVQDENFTGYGFNKRGWHDSDTVWITGKFTTEATKKEIFERLVKIAEQKGVWNVPIVDTDGMVLNGSNFAVYFSLEWNRLWSKYGRVFDNGKWATPLSTTDKEIERIEKEVERIKQELKALKQ